MEISTIPTITASKTNKQMTIMIFFCWKTKVFDSYYTEWLNPLIPQDQIVNPPL